MLVLTRKKDESILIGDDVIVTVRGISPGEVLLHVDCPAEVALSKGPRQDAHGQSIPRPAPPAADQPPGPRPPTAVDVTTEESLRIGADVRMTIEGIRCPRGHAARIRVGIVAPPEVRVFRKEILSPPADPPQPADGA